jgi:hypothetical protein
LGLESNDSDLIDSFKYGKKDLLMEEMYIPSLVLGLGAFAGSKISDY